MIFELTWHVEICTTTDSSLHSPGDRQNPEVNVEQGRLWKSVGERFKTYAREDDVMISWGSCIKYDATY